LWRWLSVRRKGTRLWLSYGRYLYARSRTRRGQRPVCEHTFFFRNPAQFEALADIACAWPAGAAPRIASIGCSTGAELYSAVWAIGRVRPDCRVVGLGVDVSDASLDAARLARYPRSAFELQRLAPEEVGRLCSEGLFEADGDALVVRPPVKDGVRWRRSSVLDPAFVDDVAPQDVVFANNMLCHFENARAEAALRNLAAILAPGGYLFMYGVDPDLKTRVIRALGLRPRSATGPCSSARSTSPRPARRRRPRAPGRADRQDGRRGRTGRIV
jgi:chemotaxis methyl-accepting protein methylase